MIDNLIKPFTTYLSISFLLLGFAPNLMAQALGEKTFPYRDVVQPILEKKCYGCHSASKMKGSLRLDSEAFINEGGEHGKVLLAGNPDKSSLYTHIMLPEDDDDHMPPKEKPQLTTQEKGAIREWIQSGASFGEAFGALQINVLNATTLNFQNPNNDAQKTKNTEGSIPSLESQILAKPIDSVTAFVLTKLRNQNIVVTKFGERQNYLMANFVNVKKDASMLIDDLKSIENQLIRLHLSGQSITDEDLKKLSNFKKLTRLNLDKTAITDAGLAYLKNLPNLEQLNLYGTQITDKGLTQLAFCIHLKVVYLWQTQTTTAGVEQLKKALPNLRVEMGGFSFPKSDSSKQK
jgi:hypothetical protein